MDARRVRGRSVARVRASVDVPEQTSAAEALWYDARRWPAFIDGFAHLQELGDQWPEVGAQVVWDSTPQGRGRVLETVIAYEARVGQTLRVEDEKIRGTQRIAFEPHEGGCRITLELDYTIKQERGVAVVIDFLFVRRPMTDSLKRTLSRLRGELAADREGIL